VISTANLGDSGYMVLRLEETAAASGLLGSFTSKAGNFNLNIFYESKEQQHQFNFPYQVGTHGDNPNSAEVNAHNIQDGDIIVLGSDGLWDNLHRPQIIDLIKPYLQNNRSIKNEVGDIAEKISKEAERYSNMASYNSPFAQNAKNYHLYYDGGKPDDITVIVG